MKKLYLLLVILISSCATFEPISEQYNYDGNRLSIERVGCSLKLTFKNNSNESLTLLGSIIVLQDGAVIAENYVDWDSRTVLPNTLVRGTATLDDGDELYSYLSKQGLACEKSSYKNNIYLL